MQKKKILLYILLLSVSAAFVFGVIRLLILRYEAGDVYPAYSSLRPDPLGTKALYTGIDNLEGIAVRRKYQPITKFKAVKETTLFYIGIMPPYVRSMDKESLTTFEEIISAGNRLIMSFPPAGKTFFRYEDEDEDEDEDEEEGEENEQKEGAEEEQEDTEAAHIAPTEQWGIDFRYAALPDHKDTQATLAKNFRQGPFRLPEAISWHASLYFDILDKDVWRIIYSRDNHPVIIERDLGKGTIVLSADSYFLSNEAMHRERHPELLVWFIGSHAEVIFDETHFGIIGTLGVATLIRKYRLNWFAAGLVFLALLFVWKNAFSFVPAPEDASRERSTLGKDITEGLINLLRRNISSKDILALCFEEWKKSFAHRRTISAKTHEEIHALIQAENARPIKDRNPVKCYRTISKRLKIKD